MAVVRVTNRAVLCVLSSSSFPYSGSGSPLAPSASAILFRASARAASATSSVIRCHPAPLACSSMRRRLASRMNPAGTLSRRAKASSVQSGAVSVQAGQVSGSKGRTWASGIGISFAANSLCHASREASGDSRDDEGVINRPLRVGGTLKCGDQMRNEEWTLLGGPAPGDWR